MCKWQLWPGVLITILGWCASVISTLDKKVLATFTHALVTSRLHYCNALHMELQLVQIVVA